MQRTLLPLLLLAFLASAACGDGTPLPTPISGVVHEDPARGFRLTVPTGWTANPSTSITQHYLDLCFSVSNTKRADLRIGDELHADGADYNADTVGRQLEPGTAYLDIGRWGGPPKFASEGESEEFAGAHPAALLAEGALTHRGNTPLTMANVSCAKWGRDWTVQLYLCEPVDAETRREVEFVLQSIEFFRPDDPVWAASVARRELPPEATALGGWPIQPRALQGRCQTDVERVPTGFRVTFSDVGPDAGSELGGEVQRTWIFLVQPDGSVKQADD